MLSAWTVSSRYTPDNLWLAALAVLAAYARQIPVRLFPPAGAVRGGGAAVPPARCPFGQSVRPAGVCHHPYGIGRFAGKDLVDSLQKNIKNRRINEVKRGSEFFFAFFLRIIEFLPGDVVSMVLGASGMTYWKFAVGSLLGLLPVMVATTVAGSSLSDPTSPVFIVTAVLVVLLSVGSFVLWRGGQSEKRGFPSGNPILNDNAPFWLENVRIHAAIVCPLFDIVLHKCANMRKNRAVRVVRGA